MTQAAMQESIATAPAVSGTIQLTAGGPITLTPIGFFYANPQEPGHPGGTLPGGGVLPGQVGWFAVCPWTMPDGRIANVLVSWTNVPEHVIRAARNGPANAYYRA